MKSIFRKSFFRPVLLSLIFIFILSYSVYALWYADSFPSDEDLRGVYIHNVNDSAFVVGNMGTIYKTTVGSNLWVPVFLDQNNPVNNDLKDIKFIKLLDQATHLTTDTQTGFVVGSEGSVFKTTDGGNNWNRINIISTALSLNSIFFSIDGQNGWIVGNGGILLKTTNAGANWIQVNTGFTENFYSISFSKINPGTGIITGSNGLILRTINSGQSWQKITAIGLNNSPIISDLNSIGFSFINGSVSSRFWIVGNDATILYSDNEGDSWTQIPSVVPYDLNKLFLHDDFMFGYAVGDNGSILLLQNGDLFFEQQRDSGTLTTEDLFSIHTDRKFRVYLTGNYGTVLYSKDGGVNHKAELSYCIDCHIGELPDIHRYNTLGFESCSLVCHANLDIVIRSPECESCHGTQLPVQHQNMNTLHNSSSICIQCHSADLPSNHINPDKGYPDTNSTCNRCHWTPLINTATSECVSCHGSQLPPQHSGFDSAHTSARQDCTGCHGNMLHQIHIDSANGYPDENSTCVRCHNNPQINISIATSDCATCHGTQIPKEHMNVTKHNSTNTYCTQCHAADLPLSHVNKTTPYDNTCTICHGTVLMGSATSDCQSCHGTQLPPEHGNFTSVHTISNTCSQCHGTLLSQIHIGEAYPEENTTCTRCHSQYTDPITVWDYQCSACHGTQLPPEHANANHNSSSSCTICHDSDLQTVHNSTCSFCHWIGSTPPSPYPNVDISKVFHGECKNCHGTQIPVQHKFQEAMHQADSQYYTGILCSSCHGEYSIDKLHDNKCNLCHPKYTDPIVNWNHDCSACHNQSSGLPKHSNYLEAKNELYKPPDDLDDGQQEGVHGHTRAKVPCLTCHNPYNKPDIKAGVSVREWFNNRCVVCHDQKTNMGTSDTKGCRPCHFYTNSSTFDFYFSDKLNNNFQGSKIWGHNIIKRNNEDRTKNPKGGKK